jgi:glycosyltransferase involved in cell wall biosynthesis
MVPDTERVVRWIVDRIEGNRVLVVGDEDGGLAHELAERGMVTDDAEVSALVVDWLSVSGLELNGVARAPSGCLALAVVGWDDAAAAYASLARRWDIAELSALGNVAAFRGNVRTEPRAQIDPAELAELMARATAELALETERLGSALRLTERELGEVKRKLRRRTVQILESSQSQQIEREQLEAQVRNAHLAAEKVKRTLSYRLGHELIHKSKSLVGLRKLPAALWEINQDAVALRRKREAPKRGLRGVLDSALEWGERLRPRAGLPAGSGTQVITRPGPDRRVSFEAPLDLSTAAGLRQLRVACIMDEFTTHCFEPECQFIALEAGNWREQIEAARPHLLFVESAWQGASSSWQAKINQQAPELKELLAWCRERGVPTAFWNKEDPVHFGTFLNVASLFDFVFTTDFDCIHRYKEVLEHERVHLLPFAAQPALHNPIEVYERKNGACFAGAYYVRYPERQRDFLRILIQLLEHGPVDIYDRNHGDTDARYQFPEPYQEFIVGKLPYSDIDRAYKGYRYGININSIKYSQSMFARRVFELLASNTITVSNFSRGIRLMFGELVIASDDAALLGRRIQELEADPSRRARLRLAALRKVLSEHTYQHRLASVASAVFAIEAPELLPTVAVAGVARTPAEETALRAAFERQDYPRKQLAVLAPGEREQKLPDADFVAWLSAADYYGPKYLTDLVLATRFYDGPVGKAAAYRWVSGRPVLEGSGVEYQTGQQVPLRAALFRPSRLPADLAKVDADQLIDGALATDPFHHCRDGAAHAADLDAAIGDIEDLDVGLSMTELLAQASRIEAAKDPQQGELRELGPSDLGATFPVGLYGDVAVKHSDAGLFIESTLDDADRKYLYERGERPLAELGFDRQARFNLQVTAGLRVEAVLIFFDHGRRRIGHAITCASTNQVVEIPDGSVFVRLGLLVVGPGSAVVKRWSLGYLVSEEPTQILGRADTLLITNQYPSPDDLYRNAFVHRRMLGYRDDGIRVDCFCLQPRRELTYYEFEGIEVTVGNVDSLRRVLQSNRYERVLVHFLDANMWKALAPHLDATRVFVWLHGAEVMPWHRRSYNYESEAEAEAAKSESAPRTAFWSERLEAPHPNLQLVFVSSTFADEVQADYDVTLPARQVHVIHNVVDTELFAYASKHPDQRLRVLSIRPFSSRKYGNDLAVEAIVELSRRPWFEELEFRIIGDGPRFDKELAPLRGMSNVILERRFLPQTEIAELYREYGVFLCPTRWDSQGVSRDEAMASGLVPVTSRVAAVPEFVDADSGFLAEPEDAAGLAAAIEALYHDPELFLRMSAAAAARVRAQSGTEQTIAREISLFAGDRDKGS